jgi:hypothetical protein
MVRAKKKIHYIYKTTCDVTGRYYIGMHSTTNIDDGYMGSGRRLRYSIRYHGKDNHTKEILEFFDTRELLIEAEIEAITPDMLTDKNCMNLKEGGEGGSDFKHVNDKGLNNKVNQCVLGGHATAKKLEDEDYAKWHSEKSSKAMKKVHDMGKVPYDNFKNKSHSEETKQKMSESSKGNGTGSSNSQFGKCWITNGIENKKIYKGDEIPEGWSLGRKMK